MTTDLTTFAFVPGVVPPGRTFVFLRSVGEASKEARNSFFGFPRENFFARLALDNFCAAERPEQNCTPSLSVPFVRSHIKREAEFCQTAQSRVKRKREGRRAQKDTFFWMRGEREQRQGGHGQHLGQRGRRGGRLL